MRAKGSLAAAVALASERQATADSKVDEEPALRDYTRPDAAHASSTGGGAVQPLSIALLLMLGRLRRVGSVSAGAV